MDVYLFLTGMMMLAELARREGFFDWLAMIAGSPGPRVRASAFPADLCGGDAGHDLVVERRDSRRPDPGRLCRRPRGQGRASAIPVHLRFIANAASFVLPISNPANLVVFGPQMPSLAAWLLRFLPPSIASILITFLMLRVALRASIPGMIRTDLPQVSPRGGRLAALGISVTALGLLAASALDRPSGFRHSSPAWPRQPYSDRQSRVAVAAPAKGCHGGVLPLVAGLFVLVEALERTGAVRALADLVATHAAHSAPSAPQSVWARQSRLPATWRTIFPSA